MKRRPPTLTDVARHAGVSYATADRVLNARGRVADATVHRVNRAIEDLGYIRNIAAANLSQRRLYRFAVLLPDGSNAFFARMEALFHAAATRLIARQVILSVERVPAFSAEALTRALTDRAGTEIDGIALVGMEDAALSRQIARVRARGIAVVTLVSDPPGSSRDAFCGIDNRAAGRTAGRLLALAHRHSAGRILPIAGLASAPDHADRLAGLADVLGEGHDILPVIEGRDRPEIVEAELTRALADGMPTAIYSVGAGNAGLLRALAALQGPRPVVVLHELVAHSRAALADHLIDAVIDQRPDLEVERTIAALRSLAEHRAPAPETQITPAVYLADNLPSPQIGETP